jgi:hypothetical protein
MMMIGKGMPNSKSTKERMVRPSKYICTTLELGKSSMAVFDPTMYFQIRGLVTLAHGRQNGRYSTARFLVGQHPGT